MSSSTSSTVLLAGSALVVAGFAGSMLFGNKSSGGTSTITEIDDDGPESDYITEDDVCRVFDRLFMEMQQVLGQLSQQIQQLQMAGQQIPEPQLRQILKSEFEKALTLAQGRVYEENDVDADCLEEATWEFLDQAEQYPKAKIAVERFQKLWENVSGESVVGKRPGQADQAVPEIELLDPEQLVKAAEVYFGALTEAMGVLVQKYKDEGKDLTSPPVAQELQMEFAANANDAGGSALAELGTDQTQFQKSIEAHANKPQVARALAMLQMKQQKDLMALGVPM